MLRCFLGGWTDFGGNGELRPNLYFNQRGFDLAVKQYSQALGMHLLFRGRCQNGGGPSELPTRGTQG